MSGFDFRDMLGGASVKLDDKAPAAIGAIGEAMFWPVVAEAKKHRCSPADVVASALTHLAVCYAKAGEVETARDMLRHVAKIAASVESALDEATGRG